MSQRAKRLVKFLEDRYGWECRQSRLRCPKCQSTIHSYGGLFCSADGAKLIRLKDDTFDQVEAALIYALKEGK